MIKERRTVVLDIARRLRPTEQAIDDTIMAHAELVAALIAARRIAGLPIDAGHAGLQKVMEATLHLAQARRSTHEAHRELSGLLKDLGVSIVGYGDTGADCPPAIASAPVLNAA